MRTNSSAFVVTVLIALTSCDHAKTDQAETQPNKPASLHNSIFESVTPAADGGAYAISSDSGLWYLRDSKAVKVEFPNLPTDTDKTFFATLQITPLLDGGAYAYSATDKSSFWHIRAGIAQRVTEVSSLSSVTPVAPLSAFPLYIAERQKRLQAEQELEERSKPEPDESNQEPYP